MKTIHRLAAAAAFAAACLPSTAAVFNFGNLAATVPSSFVTCSSTDRCATAQGGSLSFSNIASGISVSAVGTYLGNPAVTIQDAPSGGPAGLGVYHLIRFPGPVVSDTSDDNVSLGETLTMTFNQAVSISNILFRDGDHGTSFAGNFGLSIDGGAFANLALVPSFSTPLFGTTFAFKGLGNPENTKFYVNQITVSAVPEPETYALLIAGLGVMGAVARRRRNRQA
jgi:hypothetical protein